MVPYFEMIGRVDFCKIVDNQQEDLSQVWSFLSKICGDLQNSFESSKESRRRWACFSQSENWDEFLEKKVSGNVLNFSSWKNTQVERERWSRESIKMRVERRERKMGREKRKEERRKEGQEPQRKSPSLP